MKRLLFFLPLFLISCSDQMVSNNNKLIVSNTFVNDTTYYFLWNEDQDTVLKLDPKKYLICFDDTVENFLVVALRNRKGWWAVDLKGNILFEVYNTSPGEPSPDKLNEGKIRMVDSSGKIGFANDKGKVVIPPQFEMVTSFSNEKAIIGQDCKRVPWGGNEDGVDHHYSIVCRKYGYINERGDIVELGNSTLEEVIKKINWVPLIIRIGCLK